MGDLIQVQATQAGFYVTYRNPGDKFAITREGDFSHNWMLRLSPPPVLKLVVAETERIMTAPVAAAVAAAPEAPKAKRKYVRKEKIEG